MRRLRITNYLQEGTTEVLAADLLARLDQLSKAPFGLLGKDYELTDDEVAEKEALAEFCWQAANRTNKPFEKLTLVPQYLFADWLRGWMSDTPMVAELAEFVDWAAYARVVERDYDRVGFGDSVVLVR